MVYDLKPRQKALVLAGLTLGMFFNTLNFSVIGPALPKAVGEFGGLDLFSWAFTAPMIIATLSIPVAGKLSDLYGRKPFYVAGIVFFLVGNVLAGLSQSMIQLIAFRGVSGIGQGLTAATTFAIIADIFPPRERGKWMGLNSAAMGLGSVTGPLLGGVLTDGLSWRGVFFVNAPVGVGALLMMARWLPAMRLSQGRPSLDYLGMAALTGAVLPLLLAVSWGGDQFGWSSPATVALLGVSGMMSVVFIVAERRAADPLLDLELLRRPYFAASAAVGLTTGFAMWAGFLFVPLFVQAVMGKSATVSGLAQAPAMFGIMVGSVLGGQLVSRTEHYRWYGVAGTSLMAFGLLLLWMMGEDTQPGTVVRNMLISGIGLGIVMPVYLIGAQNAMPAKHLGVVTASVTFTRNMGGAIGVAVVGSALNNRLASAVTRFTPQEVRAELPQEQLAELQDPQLLLNPDALSEIETTFDELGAQGPVLFDQVVEGLRVALSDAVTFTFLVTFVVTAVAVVFGVIMKDSWIRDGAEERPEGPRAAPARPPRAKPGG